MKFKNTLFALAICLLYISNTSAQTSLIEKVDRVGKELIISYEKHLLSNGLTLLIHEDHSDPIVYVDVTYHVGSAREQEGRSGFAHFFEHMMFQGSEHVGDDQHFKIISEAGGTLNGYTTTDITNYWEEMPSNQLEIALWLESDRMGFLLDSVTQQKFETQRSTVKNERAQRYDNRPYGLVWEKIGTALYPTTHPYSWQTIGYIEDLNRVDVDDLKKFFLRWYGPNNATLTISGDVNAAEVVQLVEKYFGAIPRGPAVKQQKIPRVVLEQDRYVSYEDNIRAPQITFVFPAVPARHPDEAPLDALAEILAGNKSSIFYKTFVKSELAQFTYASNPCEELAGEFVITVRAFPGQSLNKMDSLIRASITAFETRGVTDDDLVKFNAGFDTHIITSLSSVKGKGAMLASYETYTDNPSYITKDIERYKGVTKEDIIRVYNKYIKDQHAVVMRVYPKGATDSSDIANNYTPPIRNVNAEESADYKNLFYNKAKDTLNRNNQPLPGATPVVNVPTYWKQNFANGLQLIGAKSKEVPTVTIRLYIEAGHRYENKEQAGIAEMLTDMLNESTTKHSTEEIGELLERLGSDVSVYSSSQHIIVSIFSLTKNIDATLAIAEEILFHPKFDSVEFKRVKKQQLEAIGNQVTRATTIANNAFYKILYGNDHIMSIPRMGNKETVSAITLSDVQQYYTERFSPTIASVVIVGDVNQLEILSKIDFLKSWKGDSLTHPAEPSTPTIEKTTIYLVNKEGAPQSEIRIGYLCMAYDVTGDFYKSNIMNYSLGGAFNSRINMNLREENGYTYGAHSYFSGNQFAGPFMAIAGVRADVTDSSIIEFFNEIKGFANNGIKAEELSFTKSSISLREALKYETASQKAGFIKRIMDYNLDASFTKKRAEILRVITKKEIDALAKKYLSYDKMAIIVVGDKATIYDDLVKLGYDIVELDSDGNVLKN